MKIIKLVIEDDAGKKTELKTLPKPVDDCDDCFYYQYSDCPRINGFLICAQGKIFKEIKTDENK